MSKLLKELDKEGLRSASHSKVSTFPVGSNQDMKGTTHFTSCAKVQNEWNYTFIPCILPLW
jgi:hypothetical protein